MLAILRVAWILLIAVTLSSSQYAQEPKPKDSPVTPNQSQNANRDDKSKAHSSIPESILNTELKSTEGGSFKIADYSGNVVVLNLWATWCGPCVLETKALVRLQREFKNKGVKIIGLSTENPDTSRKAVRNWVRVFNVNYRVGWAREEVLAMTPKNTAIPQSFVIGRDGRIVRRFIGFNPDRSPAFMKETIEYALALP